MCRSSLHLAAPKCSRAGYVMEPVAWDLLYRWQSASLTAPRRRTYSLREWVRASRATDAIN